MTISHGPKTLTETAQLLQLAWQRAGVSLACELCGHGYWSVIHDGTNDGLGLALRAGTNNPYLGPNYLVYAAECQKCGNVRIHGKTLVEHLANEQREFLLQRQPSLGDLLNRK